MAASKIDRQNWPAIVAHRGASATHPENTLGSFLAAADAGADMVELDVRLTADRVPVVLHDLDVSRTTGGSGLVHLMSLHELKQLDATGGRGPREEVPRSDPGIDDIRQRVELPRAPGFSNSLLMPADQRQKLRVPMVAAGVIRI